MGLNLCYRDGNRGERLPRMLGDPSCLPGLSTELAGTAESTRCQGYSLLLTCSHHRHGKSCRFMVLRE